MRLLLIFIITISCFGVIAQEYTFEIINTRNGLSQNDILDIYQDAEGYMWFGTNDGLNRYDGYDFEVFRVSQSGKNSISSNLVGSIVGDKNNNVWIGTLNGGVCIYNLKAKSFKTIRNTISNPDVLLDNYVLTITVLKDGRLWFGSLFGMQFLAEDKNGEYKVVKVNREHDSPIILDELHNYSFTEFGDSLAWVLGKNDMYLLRKDTSNIIGYSLKHKYYIPEVWDLRRIVESPYGHVLASHRGVYLIRFNSAAPGEYSIIKLSDLNSQCLAFDKEGNLWSGGTSGLQILSPTNNPDKPYKVKKTFETGDKEENIPNNYIRSIFVDKSGIVWIGTNGGGICKYNPNKRKFRTYRHTLEKGSISNNKIIEIVEDKDRNVWFGTEGGGLNLLKAENNKNYSRGFVSFDVNTKYHQNFVYQIIDIAKGNEKRFLLGTGYDSRLVELINKGNDWEIVKAPFKPKNACMALVRDSTGGIWVGTYNSGLYYYNEYRESDIYRYTSKNSLLKSDIIRSLLADSKGRLWIGTGEGLCLIKKEEVGKPNPQMKIFLNDRTNVKSISENYILPLFESSDGTVWIGTLGGGVNMYVEGSAEDNGYFKRLSTDDGLPNNVIKDFVEDFNGDIWISSNRGLTRYNPVTSEIRNYDVSDGLQDFEFGDMSGCILHDGELLFGGVNGFNAFYPNEITEDSIPPVIVFTKLQINDNVVGVGQEVNGKVILEGAINDVDLLTLGYKENNFTIHFSGIHFAAPQNNQYKYLLEGFDANWVKANSMARFAKYTNLKDGTYTFRVLASNSDGVWSPESKNIIIRIKPPYWQTWWFRLSVIFLIILILSVYFLVRIIEMKKKNIKLEVVIEKRTAEIRDKNIKLTEQTEELYEKNEELEQQTHVLNETNTQLEERQQVIEEQAEELRTQKEALEETNATKDKFYSILAHDLKNPFNTLLGYLELLKINMDKYDKEKIKGTLNIISESANLLFKLVQNLLQWSRAQRGLLPFNPQLIGVEQLIQQEYPLLKSLADAKQINLSCNIQPPDLKIRVDNNMFSTILRNICTNAIKYTPRNGSISIKAEEIENKVKFTITDTGVGIPKEEIDKVFMIDSHYTTEGTEQEKGTGLGLILCKEFMDKHTGEIWLESEQNKGTRFYFSFPKA